MENEFGHFQAGTRFGSTSHMDYLSSGGRRGCTQRPPSCRKEDFLVSEPQSSRSPPVTSAGPSGTKSEIFHDRGHFLPSWVINVVFQFAWKTKHLQQRKSEPERGKKQKHCAFLLQNLLFVKLRLPLIIDQIPQLQMSKTGLKSPQATGV